jgi:hypothetical protein
MTSVDAAACVTSSGDAAVLRYETAVRHMLPGRVEQQLLVACLGEGEAAARAWRGFADAVGDPKRRFEADQSGLKGLLPIVGSRLMVNGIDPGKAFQTYARVALVREELRSRIYGEILCSALVALNAAEISTLLLKAGALSATVYPQPSARHNHAIDLLVDDAQMAAASAVLRDLRFAPGPPGAGAAWHRDYRHWTGLALGLHSRPFFLPHFDMAREGILARARAVEIGSTTARVLSPEDSLVHVCGHATYSRSRENLRWACDAFYLIQRNPALDWQRVIQSADAAGMALQVSVLLGWLKDALGVSIPAPVRAELRNRSCNLDPVIVEGILASLLHTRMSWARALEWCRGDRRLVLEFLRFSALPSPRYLRWRYNSNESWRLPFYYVRRPVRFGLSLLRGHLHPTAQPDVVHHNVLSKEVAAR